MIEQSEQPQCIPFKSSTALLIGLIAFCGATLQVWLLWFSDLPLGVVNEWVWPRFANSFPSLIDALPSITFGAILLGYLYYTCIGRGLGWGNVRWLLGLMLLGLCWSTAVISATPAGGGLGRSVFVLFYPRTSGYFHQALYEAEDLPQFLKNYEEEISNENDPENYLHIGTHPPGLTTCFRLLIDICENSPVLTNAFNRTQPESVSAAIDFIRQQQIRTGKDLPKPAAAALWLSILLSSVLAVLTVVPLFFLAIRFCSTGTARMVAASWLLVPAVLVFLPKSDASFPFIALCLQLLWLKALEQNSSLFGILTAILFTWAASLSLAFVTIGVVLFLQILDSQKQHQRGWKPTFAGIVTGVAIVVIPKILYDFNLFTIWLQNFENHGNFYDHNTRSYFKWLWVNPIEAGVAIGFPLAVMAITGLAGGLRAGIPKYFWVLAGLLVWLLLWLSGKNMGEAGRLWIFLMPYALLIAGLSLDKILLSPSKITSRYVPLTLLALQLTVCFLTAIQIDGFGFTEL